MLCHVWRGQSAKPPHQSIVMATDRVYVSDPFGNRVELMQPLG